jgi:predicted nicotinamide N-methyase
VVSRDRIEEARAFVLRHTEPISVPLVPELRLHLATESTALWSKTEAWLEEADVPPPYWAFAWAGGQALARHILDHPTLVRGRTVLDFGSGSGIVALAACRAGAARVIAADRDPVALAACALNAELNDLPIQIEAADERGDGNVLCRDRSIDVLLAGDVFYERSESPALVEALAAAARSGILTLAGCPGRVGTPGIEQGVRTIDEYDVPGALELEGRETCRTRVLRF